MPHIAAFIEELRRFAAPLVFNPWQDCHDAYDMGSQAPAVRREQLDKYLRLRLPRARYLFVAEAVGYQGGRFSGIAMTSERMLLGHHRSVNPQWIIGGTGTRTSHAMSPHIPKETQRRLGFNEPTASVVWEAILGSISPFDAVLWNIFPFHPHREGDLLTNRTPTPQEVETGIPYIMRLLALCPSARVVAIGQPSALALENCGISHVKLRHPANGGTPAFRQGFAAMIAASGQGK